MFNDNLNEIPEPEDFPAMRNIKLNEAAQLVTRYPHPEEAVDPLPPGLSAEDVAIVKTIRMREALASAMQDSIIGRHPFAKVLAAFNALPPGTRPEGVLMALRLALS